MAVMASAIVMVFLNPLVGIAYILMEGQSLIDPDYRGYVIVAMIILALYRRYFVKE